jgi:hypothetical protein
VRTKQRQQGKRARRLPLPIGSFELRKIASDAFVEPLEASLRLGLGEILVARVAPSGREWRHSHTAWTLS